MDSSFKMVQTPSLPPDSRMFDCVSTGQTRGAFVFRHEDQTDACRCLLADRPTPPPPPDRSERQNSANSCQTLTQCTHNTHTQLANTYTQTPAHTIDAHSGIRETDTRTHKHIHTTGPHWLCFICGSTSVTWELLYEWPIKQTDRGERAAQRSGLFVSARQIVKMDSGKDHVWSNCPHKLKALWLIAVFSSFRRWFSS